MQLKFFKSGIVVVSLFSGGLLAAGCAEHEHHHDHHHSSTMSSMSPMSPTTKTSSAVDLHNTVCPVSGDEVGKSELTEEYNGKIYHFCCDDCPTEFKKDPKKYAARVDANPTKYGVHP